jgi:carboxypeptidase family protein
MTKIFVRGLVVCLFCVVAWSYTPALSAQGVRAAIQGTVRDSSGAVVPGAMITVISTETNLQRTAISNDAGFFSVPDLPPGKYRVEVSGQGFQTRVMENVELVVGQELVLNTALQIGQVTQQVTITSEAPLVDATSTSQVSGLVAERQVKDLPLNGRSFDNLIALNPVMVNSSAIKQTTSSSTGPGNYFSVGGRRPGENIFLWNGVEYPGGTSAISSTPGGVSGELLGIEAVREFNVVPNMDAAEFGHRAGGQVTIVTQSGTNTFHGSAYEFLRNSALDARNFFDHQLQPTDPRIPPFKRNQFGGSAGGPIQKDKTFVFVNYEGFRQAWDLPKVAIVPDVQARQGFLPCGISGLPCGSSPSGTEVRVPGFNPAVAPYFALWPDPNGANLGAGTAYSYNTTPNPVREDFGIVKLDRTFSSKDTFSASYTIDDGSNIGTGQNPFSAVTNIERAQVLSLSEIHVFSPSTVNSFTAGFSRVWFRYFYSVSISPAGVEPFVVGKPPGQINIGGTQGSTAITPAGSGPNTGHDQLNVDNIYTYQDNVRITKGIHSIALGGWAERLQSNDLSGTYGQTNFPSLLSFLQGKPSLFQVTQPAPPIPFRVWMAAWFAQDSIRLRSNLTLSVGLRHEFSNGYHANDDLAASFIQGPGGVLLTQPRISDSLFTTNRAKWLFGPRAAIAWDPFGRGRTSVRAGAGMAYNLLDNIGWCCINVPPIAGSSQITSNVPFPLQIVPGVTSLASATPGGGRLGIQQDPYTPTVLNYHFEIEQALPGNISLRVGYIGSHGYHEVLRADANTAFPAICPASPCPSTLPAGTKYFPSSVVRRNPQLGSAGIFFTSGVNNYNGVFVDVNRRFRNGFSLRTNYTYGHSLDNSSAITGTQAGGQVGVVMDPEDRLRDYGSSAFDVRNRVSLSGVYELPIGTGKPFLSGVKGVADKLVSGWQLNAIVNVQSGFPFTPILGFSQSRDGDTGLPDRPNWAPGRNQDAIYLRTPEHWVDATAFVLQPAGTFGNVGRNVLIGPGLAEVDMSMFKTTRLAERFSLQFRAEAFNLLNRSNFGIPNLVMLTPPGAPASSAGAITTTATTSRQIQLGLKLNW